MLKNTVCVKKLLVVIAFVMIFQAIETKAAWGDYDPSFGFGGVAVDLVTGYVPKDVALQPDGKILVTGYRNSSLGGKSFFLRRYLSNGQTDTSFGNNGAAKVTVPNYRADRRGLKIVVQANGKIAIAGYADDNYAVWQITSTGGSDTTFGQNGLQILTNYPIDGSVTPEINIQSRKLLLTLSKAVGGYSRLVLVRLNSNGAIDQTFGNSGESLTERGSLANGTVIETDGKITVSGVKYDDNQITGLERKLANGMTDSTFSPSPAGWVNILGNGLVKMANGKYAIRTFLLASNASLTAVFLKFGSNGDFESVMSPYNGFPNSYCPEVFTNQTDGKILIQSLGILFRVNAELDSNSVEMNYCTNLNGNYKYATIQNDDKMVSVGVYDGNLILARTLPN